MPHTRRRRFSIQNAVGERELSKSRQPISTVIPQKLNPDMKLLSQNNQVAKIKLNQNSTNTPSQTDIVTESKSIITLRKQSYTLNKHDIKLLTDEGSTEMLAPESSFAQIKSEKEVLNKHVRNEFDDINLFTNEGSTETLVSESSFAYRKPEKEVLTKDPRRDRTPRNKLSRQHRVKVRSPKRYSSHEPARLINQGTENMIQEKASTGTDPIVLPQDLNAYVTHNYYNNQEEDRQSNQSNEDICRICHGGESLNSEQGQLISACACRGTVGRVHVKCLERWLTESGKSRCELCSTRYATKRVHKYGIAKALVMWVLSQNAKQLLVDSLGIMLMSPLAVLAAWLSGRTLAGLMVDNHSHLAPWPLASTFVLACLTLVCYYCWIVSAATRHALGWWIWYRSQYEVRLELQTSEN